MWTQPAAASLTPTGTSTWPVIWAPRERPEPPEPQEQREPPEPPERPERPEPRGRQERRGQPEPPGRFFFNDPATTEICPRSLRGALPIWTSRRRRGWRIRWERGRERRARPTAATTWKA